MKKSYPIILGLVTLGFLITGCGQKASKTTQEENKTKTEHQEEPQAKEENSALGSFSGLVGNWTVDAETAGLKMDISFTEDGKFHQKMGENHEQSGTWEVVDDKHVKIVTPSTKGQTWLVTELTNDGVNICWNPDSKDPKTIPFQKAD